MFKRTNDGTVKIHGWYLDSIEDAWNTALEEAAKVCDEREFANLYGIKECAAAIRALKETKND